MGKLGKPLSCLKKCSSQDDMEQEDDDNNQPEHSDQSDHSEGLSQDQDVQVNRDQPSTESLLSQESTEEETTPGFSQASTVPIEDLSPRPSVIHTSPGSSSVADPNLLLPSVILTTPDADQYVLVQGTVVKEKRPPPRPQTPGLALRRMSRLRRIAATIRTKKWYRRMKGRIGTSTGKATRSPLRKGIMNKVEPSTPTSSSTGKTQSDDDQPGPSGLRSPQYQPDYLQAGPSGMSSRSSSTKSDKSSKSSSSSKKKGSKKKKEDKSEETLHLQEFDDSFQARLQFLRGGFISDPGLSRSHSDPISRRRHLRERRSWTPGMSENQAGEPNRRSLLLNRHSRRVRQISPSEEVSVTPEEDVVTAPSSDSYTETLPSTSLSTKPSLPGTPAPERRSMPQLTAVDRRSMDDVVRSRSANTLQVPSFHSPRQVQSYEELPPSQSSVPKKKRRLTAPDLPLKGLSASSELPQKGPTFSQPGTSTSMPQVSVTTLEDFQAEHTSQQRSPERPTVIQKSPTRLPQEEPVFVMPDVSNIKPEVSGEEQLVTIPKAVREESSSRTSEEDSSAGRETRREEPLVSQQEELPEEAPVRPSWLAVPESSHIDDSDYNSSD